MASVQHEMTLLNGGFVFTRGSQNSMLLKSAVLRLALGLAFTVASVPVNAGLVSTLDSCHSSTHGTIGKKTPDNVERDLETLASTHCSVP